MSNTLKVVPDNAGRQRAARVMAVASGGGHWVQLFRMRTSWSGMNVDYVTTHADFRGEVLADASERGEPTPGYYVVPEANRWQKWKLLMLLLRLALLIVRRRPDVILSTGAAPGYFACRLGALLGTKTIWVDSIANAEELSLSGQAIGRHADVWLTQWQDLARQNGPHYRGSVL